MRRAGRRKPSRSTTEGVVKRSGKQPIEESPRGGERSKRGGGSRAEEQKRYMRMGKYGRGVATTDEETEERDFEDEEDTVDRRRRSRRNSRRSYATDEEEDDDGDERRLEVHQSREELDQEDKPAMQVIKLMERDLLTILNVQLVAGAEEDVQPDVEQDALDVKPG